MGQYNDQLGGDAPSVCTHCPEGTTTDEAGSTAASACLPKTTGARGATGATGAAGAAGPFPWDTLIWAVVVLVVVLAAGLRGFYAQRPPPPDKHHHHHASGTAQRHLDGDVDVAVANAGPAGATNNPMSKGQDSELEITPL